jgi:hypothetical protein
MFERFLWRGSVALVLCTVALTAVADSAVTRPSPPRDDAAASWIDSWQLQPVRHGAGVLTHVHDDFIGPPLGPSDFGVGRYRVASLRNATHFIANTVGRPLRYYAAGRIRSDGYLRFEASRSYPLPPKRFAVVFDPVHRVTLSTDDAGDTRSSVLDTTLGKPSHAFARADLSPVRTKLGIAIGDSSGRRSRLLFRRGSRDGCIRSAAKRSKRFSKAIASSRSSSRPVADTYDRARV